MEGAARHAQRLAGNFLEDMEAIQKASRERDRRAMSHFETNSVSSNNIYPPPMDWVPRRRSLSGTPFRTSCYPMIYYSSTQLPRRRSLCVPRRRYSLSTLRNTYTEPNKVTLVGKSMSNYSRPYSVYNSAGSSLYQTPESNGYYQPQNSYTRPHLRPMIWRDYEINRPTNNEILPTSYLHASSPPKQHILSPKAKVYLKYRSLQNLSNLHDGADDENSMPRVIHTSYSRNFPLHTSRLGSVPPSAVGTYRSTITSTDYGLPPVVHRNYRTNRYIYETPYYTTTYSNIEPIRTTYTSVGPRRYTYYYPSIVTTRPLSSSGSYSNLSSDMQAERRRIERRMDDLLEYKLPSPEYYREMRGSLRALNDKLDVHRKMLDRYSGIDMNATTASVQDRIESKYQQLASRFVEWTDI
ncbi:hypothetical protein Smp_161790.1 [Schistosoma mansoni]|nr:hypothetical protein Smp_161790.1 [Schistosoma mansoni]|eukprot:XP_018648292.1 hypothetical protein Smp_161790.1 [Schistosoma mansoni]